MADPSVGRPPALLFDLAPIFEYETPYGLASAVYSYDFQARSDKLLPAFSPPLPEPERLALEGRRLIAARDWQGALAKLQAAKAAARSARWDAQIAWVEARMAPPSAAP
jgi:hypothetical protein